MPARYVRRRTYRRRRAPLRRRATYRRRPRVSRRRGGRRRININPTVQRFKRTVLTEKYTFSTSGTGLLITLTAGMQSFIQQFDYFQINKVAIRAEPTSGIASAMGTVARSQILIRYDWDDAGPPATADAVLADPRSRRVSTLRGFTMAWKPRALESKTLLGATNTTIRSIVPLWNQWLDTVEAPSFQTTGPKVWIVPGNAAQISPQYNLYTTIWYSVKTKLT